MINIDPGIEDFKRVAKVKDSASAKQKQPGERTTGRLGTKFHVVQFVNTLKSRSGKRGRSLWSAYEPTVNNAAREDERIFAREYRAIPFGKRLIFNSRDLNLVLNHGYPSRWIKFLNDKM